MSATRPTLELAEKFLPDVVRLRRALHRVPELDLDLPKTQALLLEALAGLDLEITLGEGLSSITAVLRGGRGPGPVVLLRGDMDALPVVEATGLPYASAHEGRMHACGHDLHAAGLVGAARILHAVRDDLRGDVVLMFQPGEEQSGGALPMLEQGVLTAAGRRVDSCYSVHVHSAGLPFGVFRSRPGVINAHNEEFVVRVLGAGGHASSPWRVLDPLPAACEMVLAMQARITRSIDVFDPAVLTIGRFVGGTKDNVIPDVVEFGGTIRCFSEESLATVRGIVADCATGIAKAHGLKVVVERIPGYPACVNDAEEFEHARRTVVDLFGEDRFRHSAHPAGSGDDFAYVMRQVPGAYFGVGACASADPETAAAGHSPRAVFDDAILRDTSAFLAELAIRRLARG